MFDLFFLKYKDTFHKASLKNIAVFECLLLGILLISACTIIFSAYISANQEVFGVSLIAIIIDIIGIFIYEKIKSHKQIDARIQNYKTNKIDKLTDLLKEHTYNLYSIEGITWLINCCEKNIEPKQSVPLGSTIFPILTLAFGVILKDMPMDDVISMTTALIIIIVLVVLLQKYAFSYICEIVQNPDKDLYKYLKNELEYILIQLKNSSPPSGTP